MHDDSTSGYNEEGEIETKKLLIFELFVTLMKKNRLQLGTLVKVNHQCPPQLYTWFINMANTLILGRRGIYINVAVRTNIRGYGMV